MADRDADPLLTYSEAAAELRCSERHVYRLVDGGELEAEHVGNHRNRIRRSAVDRFLEQRRRRDAGADEDTA